MRRLFFVRVAVIGAPALVLALVAFRPAFTHSNEAENIVPGHVILKTDRFDKRAWQRSPGGGSMGSIPASSLALAKVGVARAVRGAIASALDDADVAADLFVRPLRVERNASPVAATSLTAQGQALTAAGVRRRMEGPVTYHRIEIPSLKAKGIEGAKQTLALVRTLRLMGYKAMPDLRVRALDFPLTEDPDDPFFATSGAWGQPFGNLEGLQKINALAAWRHGNQVTLGSGVRVAVIDTGVDSGHEDLIGSVVQGPDFIEGGQIPTGGNDEHSHGTHVAGTIAAIADNGKGIAGVAPAATIVGVRVLDADGFGSFSDVAEAVEWASDPAGGNVDVINLSLGSPVEYDDEAVEPLNDAIDLALERGVVVVVAAGNESANVRLSSPANHPGVIAVSAVRLADDEPAFFSNFGGGITVGAPGGGDDEPASAFAPEFSVLSLLSRQATVPFPLSQLIVQGTLADDYIRYAGTSMAAPHVAGAAALWIGRYPLPPGASAAERRAYPEKVRQAILRRATDIGDAGFDLATGYGLLNADGALDETSPTAVHLSAPAGTVLSSETYDVKGTVSGTGSYTLYVAVGELPASSHFVQRATGTAPLTEGVIVDDFSFAQYPKGPVTFKLVSNGHEFRLPVFVDRRYFTSPDPSIFTPVRRGATVTMTGQLGGIGNFKRYYFRVFDSDGDEVSPAPVTPASSTTQVQNGTLGTFNTAGLPDDHYRVALYVEVCATGSSCTAANTITSEPEVAAFVVDSGLRQGFPIRLATAPLDVVSYDQLTTANVDGSGGSEILVSNYDQVYVFKSNGASLTGWPRFVSSPSADERIVLTAPAVGELDPSPGREVAAVACELNQASAGGLCSSSVLFVWKSNGSLLAGWPKVISGEMLSVTIADLNGDGSNDLLLSQGEKLHAFRANGQTLSGWPRTSPEYFTAAAVGDVTGDGAPEVVVSTLFGDAQGRYTIKVLSGAGAEIGSIPISTDFDYAQFSHVALGDLDRDGVLDIVYGSVDGKVHAYHPDGVAVEGWPRAATTAETQVNAVTLGDVDGNGALDVVVSGNLYIDWDALEIVSELVVLRHDGTQMFRNESRLDPFDEISPIDAFGFGAAAVADVNGDGREEILVASGSNWPYRALHAFTHTGAELAGFPKLTGNIGNDSTSSPSVAFTDEAGARRLAWLDASLFLSVWDSPSLSNGGSNWPQYRGAEGHPGVTQLASFRGSLQSGAGQPSLQTLSCGSVHRQPTGSSWPSSGFLLLIALWVALPRVAGSLARRGSRDRAP